MPEENAVMRFCCADPSSLCMELERARPRAIAVLFPMFLNVHLPPLSPLDVFQVVLMSRISLSQLLGRHVTSNAITIDDTSSISSLHTRRRFFGRCRPRTPATREGLYHRLH